MFAAGFFASAPVQTALAVGGGAAVVSAVVGVFTVLRGQSFAGHALADVSSAGGAAAFLLGVNPMLGYLAVSLLAAAGMEASRTSQPRERDLVTGIALGGGLGLSALLLYLAVTTHAGAGATVSVMFGSMFALSPAILPWAAAAVAVALVTMGLLWRPLLLCSLAPDLAAARGVKVRLVGFLHLLALALAVSLSALTVGAVLSTALLIGPAATALHLARRPAQAVAGAVLLALATTWGGILLAYESYTLTPGHAWPVSFCVVTLVFVAHLLARLGGGWLGRGRRGAVGKAG